MAQLNKAKSFLDTVLGKLSKEDQDAMRSLYSQAHDEVNTLYQHMANSIAAVNKRAQEQADWWEKNKHLAGQPNNGGGGNNNNGNPQPTVFDPAPLMAEFDKRMTTMADQLAGQGLALSTILPTLVAQHGVEFGEVLDAEKLAKDAIAANTDIKAFYNQSVAERRATKTKEKYDADIKAAEERGRVAGIVEAGKGQLPYPSSRQSVTTLSGLRKPAPDQAPSNQFTLDAAVATATEVMQRQAGSA